MAYVIQNNYKYAHTLRVLFKTITILYRVRGLGFQNNYKYYIMIHGL